MSIKSLKTPLRYPGGKSRALSKLFQFFPDLKDYGEYREPLIGGGSVELEVKKRYPNIKSRVTGLPFRFGNNPSIEFTKKTRAITTISIAMTFRNISRPFFVP